jgi:hypothetical protein
MAARTIPGVGWSFLSADELWAALAPRSYRIIQRWIEGTLHPAVWNPILATVLWFPAWLLLGVPGGLLAYFFRPHRETPADFDPDAPFLYDELVKNAEEEGYGDRDDPPPADNVSRVLDSAREAGAYALNPDAFRELEARLARSGGKDDPSGPPPAAATTRSDQPKE